MMRRLGVVRMARWFVARTLDFNGPTLFFIAQFDGTLEGFLDDLPSGAGIDAGAGREWPR